LGFVEAELSFDPSWVFNHRSGLVVECGAGSTTLRISSGWSWDKKTHLVRFVTRTTQKLRFLRRLKTRCLDDSVILTHRGTRYQEWKELQKPRAPNVREAL